MAEWSEVECPEHGFAVVIPTSYRWRRHEDGAALVAYRDTPEPGESMPDQLAVTVHEVSDAEAWAEDGRTAVAATLLRARLIDDRQVPVPCRHGRRLLLDFLHPAFGGAVLEQWYLAHESRGYVLSVATQSYAYHRLALVAEKAASSIRHLDRR